MVDNPAQKLAQLLNDTNQPEWKRSAQALALAFAWNQATLQSTQNSRAGLLQALSELTKVLVEIRDASRGLGEFVDKASPGPTLREAVVAEQASLSRLASEVHALQTDVAQLEQVEQKNRTLIAEHKKLQERRQELANLESFDPSVVDSLRKQVQAVEDAKPWLSDLEKIKQRLQDNLPWLEQLSGEALMALQEEDKQILKKAQDTLNAIRAEARQQSAELEQINQNIHAVQDDISARQKRYQEAESELHLRKDILDQYIQVDQEIAAAINNPEAKQAQQILSEIEAQLRSVDKALKLAIEANEKAKAIQNIPM